jgi:hypothetical protein
MKFRHVLFAGLTAVIALGSACSEPAPAESPGNPLLDAAAVDRPTADGGLNDARTDGAVDAALPQDFAEPPTLSSISPASARVRSVGPTLVVLGQNFVRRTVIQLEGAVLPTTFVSNSELRTTLPSARLLSTGRLRISIGTAPPGGGASAELFFDVVYGTPVLTSIAVPTPPSALVGAPDTKLVVTGTDFGATSTIAFNGTELTTTVVSESSLSATIPASMLSAVGSFPVTVKTPTAEGGGGISSSIAFTVSNPSVQLSGISPITVTAGAPSFTLTLDGTGFLAGSSVSLNGTQLTSNFVNATKLTASVPTALVQSVGDLPVVVTNPLPGGGVSVPRLLSVVYAIPTTSSLAPATALAGDSPATITIGGSGFYPASQVTFNNAAAATTYVNPTQLRATITAAQLAAAGAVAVRVVNPAPAGGVSAAQDFQVNNPAPQIASVVPATPAFVGIGATQVTVNGTRFVGTSTLRVNNAALLTSFVNSTQLTATVPASAFAGPGNLQFTVVNPGPGGGTSSAVTLAVGCNTAGVDYPLRTLNVAQSVSTNFRVANTTTSQMYYEAKSCPATFADNPDNTPAIRPYRAIVVQNTTSASATLAAWATCASTDDAYLTFYRRGTVPMTLAEREVCTQYIAEGEVGAGAFTSPEANGSSFCPGLTKANGGGISLNVCEKAVVYIQPFSLTTPSYSPPVNFKISLQ